MKHGWVVSQLSHLSFGGKEGEALALSHHYSTHFWLVALTLFEVGLSLTTRLTVSMLFLLPC